jgi:hypothetical protein
MLLIETAMHRPHMFSAFALALVASLGVACSAPLEEGEGEVGVTIDALTNCTATPATADEAKYRIIGFIVGDGVATTKGTYHLSFPRETFANYIKKLLVQSGMKYTLGQSSVDIPRSEIGDLMLAQQGTKYPYPILPELENAPAIPPYSTTSPGCRIRHFVAAVLQVDGAATSGTGPKRQQVLDDPHPRKLDEFATLWRNLGASSARVSGQSVLIDPADNRVAQCLPNLYFARVPGGEPAPGTCP